VVGRELPIRVNFAVTLLALALAAGAAPAAANNYASAENGRIVFSAGLSGNVLTISPHGGAVGNVKVAGKGSSLIYGARVDPTGRRIVAGSRRPGPVCTPVPNEPPLCQPIDESLLVSVNGGRGKVVAQGLATDFSPDGKRILSWDDGTIRSSRVDGKAASAIGAGSDAVFSPSGDAIAFHDGRGISLIRADGTARVPLTSPPADFIDVSPSFSPDGQRVAFVRTRVGGPEDLDIYSVAIGGTDLRNLTSAFDPPADDPEYSPDGEMIAFHGGESFETPDRLYLMDVDGSDIRRLAETPLLVNEVDWAPIFHCAGKRATVVGDDGADRITGTRRADVIVGNAGSDRIDGRGGRDRICGGRGNDRLLGGSARDNLVGGPGRDRARQ
jgi:WD40 repeat protein